MTPYQRQKQILSVFKGDQNLELKKQQIIYRGDIWYYANTDKHVQNTLGRMVKNGKLERTKRGTYRLGGVKRIEPKETDPNQTDLFK